MVRLGCAPTSSTCAKGWQPSVQLGWPLTPGRVHAAATDAPLALPLMDAMAMAPTAMAMDMELLCASPVT